MNSMLITWIVLAVVFAVTEAATAQILTMWFAVGSVAAIVANVAGAKPAIQLAVFVAASILTLIIVRPILKRFMKTDVQPTNVDMNIGKEALVTEEINNTLGTGQAIINGVTWTVRSKNGETIPKDSKVIIESIQGAKLIVNTI